MRNSRVPLWALVVLAIAASACGGSGDSEGVASATGSDSATGSGGGAEDTEDAEEAMLEFADCMRANGVPDFPDPEVDGDGRLLFRAPAGGERSVADEGDLQRAQEKCADLLPEGGPLNLEDNAEMQDAMLEFAQCMRDEGVTDFPDPDFSGGGVTFGAETIDRNDPTFAAAQQKCEDILAGAFGRDS